MVQPAPAPQPPPPPQTFPAPLPGTRDPRLDPSCGASSGRASTAAQPEPIWQQMVMLQSGGQAVKPEAEEEPAAREEEEEEQPVNAEAAAEEPAAPDGAREEGRLRQMVQQGWLDGAAQLMAAALQPPGAAEGAPSLPSHSQLGPFLPPAAMAASLPHPAGASASAAAGHIPGTAPSLAAVQAGGGGGGIVAAAAAEEAEWPWDILDVLGEAGISQEAQEVLSACWLDAWSPNMRRRVHGVLMRCAGDARQLAAHVQRLLGAA
ncbi:hypothetical protein ABPG75_002116 [Micractinium tetrahymenae]